MSWKRRGYCRIAPGGVVIDTAGLSRPAAVRRYRETEANLQGLLFRLRRTRVLGVCDADLATCPAAAPRT